VVIVVSSSSSSSIISLIVIIILIVIVMGTVNDSVALGRGVGCCLSSDKAAGGKGAVYIVLLLDLAGNASSFSCAHLLKDPLGHLRLTPTSSNAKVSSFFVVGPSI